MDVTSIVEVVVVIAAFLGLATYGGGIFGRLKKLEDGVLNSGFLAKYKPLISDAVASIEQIASGKAMTGEEKKAAAMKLAKDLIAAEGLTGLSDSVLGGLVEAAVFGLNLIGHKGNIDPAKAVAEVKNSSTPPATQP